MKMSEFASVSTAAVERAAIRFLDYLPSLAGAILLLLIGWLAAHLLKKLTQRLAARGLRALTQRKSLRARLQQSPAFLNLPTTMSRVVYWLVLLFFATAAIDVLGLTVLSDVLANAATYVPKILGALVIMAVGLWLGETVRGMLSRTAAQTSIGHGETVGRLSQIGTVTIALILALDQLGINSTILVVVLVALFVCTFGAGALAFGLGAGNTVRNILGMHYSRGVYQVGDRIRINAVEGEVTSLSRTAVTLSTPDGLVSIPGQYFSDEKFTLLPTEQHA